jgi:uncharacterized protein
MNQSHFMDRFMLHLKNENFIPKNASDLLHQAREICSGMDITIRDARVSRKYLEFDISTKKEKLDETVQRLKILGELDHAKHVIEEKKSKDDSIKEGIFYFNDERFWECHEILESVWKNCYEGEKDLVQGIILVAAALVHYQKNENQICISILKRALDKLSNASGNYYNIDVDSLKNKINEMKNSGQVSTFVI